MCAEASKREKRHLVYPSSDFAPSVFLGFVQFDSFCEAWKELGLDDDGLRVAETVIMAEPEGSGPVSGVEDLRSVVICEVKENGDSGPGVEIGYAYYQGACKVLLMSATDADEGMRLTDEEKVAIRTELEQARKFLEQEKTRSTEHGTQHDAKEDI